MSAAASALKSSIRRKRHEHLIDTGREAQFVYLGEFEKAIFEEILEEGKRYRTFTITEEELRAHYPPIIWEGSVILYVNTASHLRVS